MNILQIYLLGCFLAYPIGVYVLKIIEEPNSNGTLKQTQMFLKNLGFDKGINFYYNLAMSMVVFCSWVIVIVFLYIYIKTLFYIIKYYLFRK